MIEQIARNVPVACLPKSRTFVDGEIARERIGAEILRLSCVSRIFL